MRRIWSSASWTIALWCEQFLRSHLSWTLVVIVEENSERDSLVWASKTNKCNERTSEKTDTKSMQERSAKLWQKRSAKLWPRRWKLDNRETRKKKGKKRSLLAGQQKNKRLKNTRVYSFKYCVLGQFDRPMVYVLTLKRNAVEIRPRIRRYWPICKSENVPAIRWLDSTVEKPSNWLTTNFAYGQEINAVFCWQKKTRW